MELSKEEFNEAYEGLTPYLKLILKYFLEDKSDIEIALTIDSSRDPNVFQDAVRQNLRTIAFNFGLIDPKLKRNNFRTSLTILCMRNSEIFMEYEN